MSAPVVIFGEALVDAFDDLALPGGAPFKVARPLAGFGLQALMITRIGDDAHGALVRAQFARFGLSTAGLQIDPDRATGRVVRVLADCLCSAQGGTLPPQKWTIRYQPEADLYITLLAG